MDRFPYARTHRTCISDDSEADDEAYQLQPRIVSPRSCPQAQKVLMAKGIIEPAKTGLGADVMPKIVELANNGAFHGVTLLLFRLFLYNAESV